MSDVQEKKREVILNPEDIGLSQHRRQDWVCVAKEGTALEDVLNPVFWSHMAARFQPFDRVEVREETGLWLAELMVLRAERNWASVALLHQYDLGKLKSSADVNDISAFDVKWGGPVHKWRVIRKVDAEVIHAKEESQEDALKWLRQYEATQRR